MSDPHLPVLSVLLVVHQEQAYVEGCARSVLDHPGRDVELVIVDNASSGYVPSLLSDLAERDDRVSVIRLDEAVPQGTARAAALGAARGDYVWSLDTVDRFGVGAVGRVIETVSETRPDVALVDYVVGGPLGDVPSARSELIRKLVGRKPVTVDKRPALIDLAPSTWALVMRRGLLVDRGISAAGRPAEAGVGYCALLTAESIVAVPGASYRRLSPRNAVRVRAIHGGEMSLADEFRSVFAFLDGQGPDLEKRRRLAAGWMMRAGTQRLNRVPSSLRRAFARQVVETIGPRLTGDAVLPPGRLMAIRARLLHGGHPAAYRFLEWMLRTARSAKERLDSFTSRQRRRAGRWMRGARTMEYRLLRRVLPLQPDLAVFASYWFRGYACNPRAIYEKMRELAPGVRGIWVVERGVKLPDGIETVVAGSRAYFRLLARATYFVNNVNYPNHWQKRKGQVHLQTHHGTPLKRMGLDLKDAIGQGQRTNFRLLLRRASQWDYSLSSNRLTTLVWERVYPIPYTTLEYGYPRNDRLANATPADVAAARAELDVPDGVRILLYAPTHREYERSYRSLLDTVRLAESLGEQWVVLSRAHYFYDTGQPVGSLAGGRVIDVTSHSSIEQLCIAADVLVTDYSSVMFDYAVLDRPVVIYAPDWETYRLLRGTYFDLVAEPPGVVCVTEEEVADAITSGAYASDVAAKARRVFRSRFCAWDDGHAAERVVRRLFLSEEPESPANRAAA